MRFAMIVGAGFALVSCTSIFGLRDVDTVDRDNDGVTDGLDNCVDVANPDQSDFDANGMGDACDLCTDGGDTDVDGDHIPDGCDGCIGIGADSDRDGIDDGCDLCINTHRDVDRDGIDDGCDPCIGNTGVDADLDGIDDACDLCIGNSGVDVDADGFDDACDQCIGNRVDADLDGIDDNCDLCVSTNTADVDGDKIQDGCDPCICKIGCTTPKLHDEDKDTIDDGCDNCVGQFNTGQLNTDEDGVGNSCDPQSTAAETEEVDTFVDATHPWYVQGAGWTIAKDVASVSEGKQTFRFFTNVLQPGSFRVATRAQAVQWAASARLVVALADTLAQPAPTGVACVASLNLMLASPRVSVQLTEVQSNVTQNLGTPATVPYLGTDKYDVILTYHAATKMLVCDVVTTGASASTTASATFLYPPLYPGIAVEAGAFDLSYVSAIGTF